MPAFELTIPPLFLSFSRLTATDQPSFYLRRSSLPLFRMHSLSDPLRQFPIMFPMFRSSPHRLNRRWKSGRLFWLVDGADFIYFYYLFFFVVDSVISDCSLDCFEPVIL